MFREVDPVVVWLSLLVGVLSLVATAFSIGTAPGVAAIAFVGGALVGIAIARMPGDG